MHYLLNCHILLLNSRYFSCFVSYSFTLKKSWIEIQLRAQLLLFVAFNLARCFTGNSCSSRFQRLVHFSLTDYLFYGSRHCLLPRIHSVASRRPVTMFFTLFPARYNTQLIVLLFCPDITVCRGGGCGNKVTPHSA
jgi:hypothetical protein